MIDKLLSKASPIKVSHFKHHGWFQHRSILTFWLALSSAQEIKYFVSLFCSSRHLLLPPTSNNIIDYGLNTRQRILRRIAYRVMFLSPSIPRIQNRYLRCNTSFTTDASSLPQIQSSNYMAHPCLGLGQRYDPGCHIHHTASKIRRTPLHRGRIRALEGNREPVDRKRPS